MQGLLVLLIFGISLVLTLLCANLIFTVGCLFLLFGTSFGGSELLRNIHDLVHLLGSYDHLLLHAMVPLLLVEEAIFFDVDLPQVLGGLILPFL